MKRKADRRRQGAGAFGRELFGLFDGAANVCR